MMQLTAQKHSQLKIILWGAFLALAAVALLVVFLLPSQITITPQEPQSTSSQRTPLQIASDAKVLDKKIQEAGKSKAEKLLTKALGQLAKLESEGVQIWGIEALETSLPAAEESLKKANSFYDRQQYTHSLKHFQKAITAFDQLGSSRKERFEITMKKGLKAFEVHDSPTAIAQFKIAAALRPGDDKVTKMLDRAKNHPKVLLNISQGKELEATSQLNKARDYYQAAITLDAAYAPAKKSLQRVKKKIAERDYKQAISNAYLLLDQKNLKEASRALKRAQTIRPTAPEIQELTNKITSATQVANLNELHKQALAYEKQEQWSNALKSYQKAFMIDNNATFANRGKSRAQTFLDLYKAIDSYLNQPDRLYSAEPLAHAKVLYEGSLTLDGSGSLLEDKRNRLRNLISLAETPIPVLLKSDQKTKVTIYRIGRFGVFDMRRIELKPGSYTIVGSRPGYREVRTNLKVLPSSKDLVVTVQCKEPVR